MSSIKKIEILSGASYVTRDIGAEAQNVSVGRDSEGKIIPDVEITEPTTREGLTSTLRTIEAGKQEQMQYTSIPTATKSGQVIQYIGPTTEGYKTGFFYRSVATQSGVYEWVEQPVSAGGGSGSGDMTKAEYTNASGNVLVSKGGTGSSDGTLNGVKLGTSGNGSSKVYGYYKDGASTLTPFRYPVGGANAATAGHVLRGKHFATEDGGDDIVGTMYDRGGATTYLNCEDEYLIEEGYHNGTGVVIANTLASQTGVDSGKIAINSNAVLSGYQGWVSGQKISGSIPNRSAGQAVASVGYSNGTMFLRIPTGAYMTPSWEGYHEVTYPVQEWDEYLTIFPWGTASHTTSTADANATVHITVEPGISFDLINVKALATLNFVSVDDYLSCEWHNSNGGVISTTHHNSNSSIIIPSGARWVKMYLQTHNSGVVGATSTAVIASASAQIKITRAMQYITH